MKSSNKKKFFLFLTACLLTGIGFGIYDGAQENRVERTEEVGAIYDGTQSYTSSDTLESERFKDLAGLTYDVLNSSKIIQNGIENYEISLDIQAKATFSKNEWEKLHASILKEAKKQVGKNISISGISINIFNSKEAYQLTLQADYDGVHTEGQIQKYSSVINEDSVSVEIYEYLPYAPKSDVKQVKAQERFEITDAYSFDEDTKIHSSVIIETADNDNISDMFQALISMIQVSNNGVQGVNLTVYKSKGDYEENHYSYMYNVANPTFITHKYYDTY